MNLYAQDFNPSFIHYTSAEGLPSMNVYDAAQDSKGYMWIATEEGVCKFNGYNFTLIDLGQHSVSNDIISIYIDTHDRVWLNSAGPLRYIENDSIRVMEDINLTLDWYFNMLEDDYGNLWIVSHLNVYCLDLKTLKIKSIPEELFEDPYKYQFLTNHDSKVYILSSSGIQVLDNLTAIDTISYPAMAFSDQVAKNKPIIAWPYLYYNNYDGLWQMNLETNKKTCIDAEFRNIKRMALHNNTLIVSLESGGFYSYKFDDEHNIILKRPFLKQLNIGGYYFDDHENLWIPTYMAGLYLFKPKSKYIKNYTKTDDINAISVNHLFQNTDTTNKTQTLWIGSSSGVIYKVVNDTIRKTIDTNVGGRQFNRIMGFGEIEEDHFLIANDEGLIEYKNGKKKQLIKMAFKGMQIHNSKVVISTHKYSSVIDLETLLQSDTKQSTLISTQNHRISHYNETRAFCSFIDSNEAIWISNQDKGLYKISEFDTVYYNSISPIFKRQCHKIAELKSGIIIANLTGLGIVLIKDDYFLLINTKRGLSSNVISDFSVLDHTIYISTNNGINILDIDSLDLNNYSIKVINKSTGLRTNEINSISVNKDFIYAGTRQGIITIDRHIENTLNQAAPDIPLYISSVMVNGISISLDTIIDLNHEQNDIRVSYSSINYDRPNTAYYAYKMDGVDNTWSNTHAIQASYNNLEPGSYVFNVGLVNGSQSKPKSTTYIKFNIKGRFVDTLAFKLIALLLFSTLVGVCIFSRLLKIKKNKLALEVQIKTKELTQSLNELKLVNNKLIESNETLKNYAHIASHDLKSPLRHIGGFIQLFQMKNKDKLVGVDFSYLEDSIKSVKKMEHTIRDLLIFASINNQISKQHIHINKLVHEITDELQETIVDRNVSIETNGLETSIISNLTGTKQVLYNLIENAIKYNTSENPIVEIKYSPEEQYHRFEVSDNGIGIPKKYSQSVFELFKRLHNDTDFIGSGIGLAICKRIIDKSGGSIYVEPNCPSGSTFVFTIPMADSNKS